MKTLKRKVSLLFAVLFVGMMAFSSFADTTDTVDVLIKNVPGGALRVWYCDADTGEYLLPIDETVKLPKGSELSIELSWTGFDWYSETAETYYWSELSEVTVKEGSGVEETFVWDRDRYQNQMWTLSDNTVIEAKYVVEEYWGGNEPWFWHEAEGTEDFWIEPVGQWEINYDSPTQVEMDLEVYYDGNKIAFSDFKKSYQVFFGTDGRYEGAEAIAEMCEDLFEFTDTGIRSKGQLPLGRYEVPISYQSTKDGWINEIWVSFSVGKRVSIVRPLGIYKETIDGATTQKNISADEYNFENDGMSADPYQELTNSRFYFDGRTTVGEVLQQIATDDGLLIMHLPRLFGYGMPGQVVSSHGELLNVGTTTLLKEATSKEEVRFTPVVNKGNTSYRAVEIQAIADKDVQTYYDEYWKEEDGKWYFYLDNELVTSQWIETETAGLVFVDSTGALVMNGIAGNAIGDEFGLWLVDDKGIRDEDFSGEKTFGGFKYQIADGQVTEVEMLDVVTPSNATEVSELVSGASSVMSQMSDAQKKDIADMVSAGLVKIENAAISDELIMDMDALFWTVYAGLDVKPEIRFDREDGIDEDEDAIILADNAIDMAGLFAAAGYTSKHADDNVPVKVALKQLNVSTDSNAKAKEVLRFEAKLMVGNKKQQLKSPLLMSIELPSTFFELYPADKYNYTMKHIMDNGSVDSFIPDIDEESGRMYVRVNSFSEFALTVQEKPKRTYHYSGTVAKKETTPVVTVVTGEWVQDATGWWYKNADGTWPKAEWKLLDWNGKKTWYYFNADGYMAIGWIFDNGYWYYLNPVSDGSQGAMCTGWKEVNGIWYYLNATVGMPYGAMFSNRTTPDGYWVDANGAWIQ